MSSLLDRAYELIEAEQELEKVSKQKVCPACDITHTDDTDFCFNCKYINNNI